MFKLTKAASAIICFSIAVSMLSIRVQCDIEVSSKAAVLINASDNSTLFEKNADMRLPMASTTKIMTALTVLDFYTEDALMTIPDDSVGTEGTSAYLEAGEVYTLIDLLYALLLQSANDAASAIAINAAGSEDAFAHLMNRKARSLGLINTRFKNPHGLPSEGHYTTARELSIIASCALKNNVIADIVATKQATIKSAEGKKRTFYNHNKLLTYYQGANGVKTGYTKESGRCLVSSAERGGIKLVAVTLNSHNDWREHEAMLNYGFNILSKAQQ